MKTKGRVRHRRKKGRGGNLKQLKWKFYRMCQNAFSTDSEFQGALWETREGVTRKVGTFSSSTERHMVNKIGPIDTYRSDFCQ